MGHGLSAAVSAAWFWWRLHSLLWFTTEYAAIEVPPLLLSHTGLANPKLRNRRSKGLRLPLSFHESLNSSQEDGIALATLNRAPISSSSSSSAVVSLMVGSSLRS